MTPTIAVPSGASSASEWLTLSAGRLSAAPDAEKSAQLAAVAFLAASLERQWELTEPSANSLAPLEGAMRRLPAQTVHLSPAHPAYLWLQLSALAEFLGEPSLARIIVDAVATLSGEHQTPRRSNKAGMQSAERDEVLAICWCRRGRISRIAGTLDDAQYCYDEAVALVQHAPWRDARPAAELGRVNIAILRGNFPLAERLCTALLSEGQAQLTPLHATALYQMRAIAYRKRAKLLDALLDSWRAYDLMGHASAHRTELVVSMAETALEAGDTDAAIAGFRSALREAAATHAQLRVRAAATTGLARTINSCLLQGGTSASGVPSPLIRESIEALRTLLREKLDPRERVYALVTDAEWSIRESALDAARDALAKAQALAVAHAYFDYQFRIESLQGTLAEPRTNSQAEAASAATGSVTAGLVNEVATHTYGKPERHPALARLAALA